VNIKPSPSRKRPLRAVMVGAGLTFAIVASAQQATSLETAAVQGKYRPQAKSLSVSNVSRPGSQPKSGDRLRINYSFEDLDGDQNNGSTFEWRRGSTLVSTSQEYVTTGSDADQTLTGKVLARTNPAITEPYLATAAASTTTTVYPAGVHAIDVVLATPNYTGYGSVNISCPANTRRPTIEELRQMYLNSTSATVPYPSSGWASNTEMCSRYGLPLSGLCGGRNDSGSISYADWWRGNSVYMLNMRTGETKNLNGVSGTYLTVCVKG
jgi:hypothetical protein